MGRREHRGRRHRRRDSLRDDAGEGKIDGIHRGLGNPVIATAEFGGSLLVSLLALAAPLLTLIAIVLLLWLGLRWLRRMSQKAPPKQAGSGTA